MMKLYDIDNEGGGGGNAPNPPTNYKPISVDQRTQWNNFLDYANKQQGVDFDKDPQAGARLMAAYKKSNPNFSLTPEQVSHIQYEQYQLRKGETFGNLKPEQLKYLRQGLPATYLNRPIPEATGQFNAATSKLYYPQKTANGKTWGTDIESYVNGVGGQPVASNAPIGTIAPDNTPLPAGAIPRPDYGDTASRLGYAKSYAKKYGIEEGYGDIPLRVNEVPLAGSSSVKNIAVNSAKLTGIDPALLYSSAMVEGASGTFHNQSGEMAGHIYKSEDPDFPIYGAASYGLNNFVSRVPEMVKKGYLPEGFENQYKKWIPDEKNKKITDSALFKTSDAAMTAKAARLKLDYDEIEDYAKKKGITLSPQARDFFALAHYNSGLGKQMLDKYNKNGYLKGDAFMKANPDGSYPEVYKHVALRLREREGLKKEGLFP